MNGLPMMGDPARILADQVGSDFEGAGGAGARIGFEHLAPATDASVRGDLHEDPGVLQGESLDAGDRYLLVGADGSLSHGRSYQSTTDPSSGSKRVI